MASFVKKAGKQISDVRAFLREAAGGNSIKYAAEKGARHILYFPYTTQQEIDQASGAEVMTKTICAISGGVHEWNTSDGKFKSTICLNGIVDTAEDGTVINDGSCPFCDRVTDAWNIYNWRKEHEEATCNLTGDQLKNHLEKTLPIFRNEMKAKAAKMYMYILVVKFKLNDAGIPSIGADNLPEYELKVMKLSSSRVEKIQQQIVNSGDELAGSELIFEYPNVDDRRLLVSQSTTTPVFPKNRLTEKYPDVLNKINADVAKFEWDGIEKAFPEWAGMTSLQAKTTMDSMFEEWDNYQKELTTNPTAKYLEYLVKTPTAKPNLNGADAVSGALPVNGGVALPNVPNIAVPQVPNVGEGVIPGVGAVPQVPQVPNLDPNAVFAGAGASPTINI